MFDQKLRLDIRIIKFQDYIRRKPDSPFGYYGLGVQYMLSGRPSLADRMFMHALKVDPAYTPARIGRLEFLLSGRKFLSAARYYQKNKEFFLRKKIYMNRIHHATSQLYLSRGFYQHAKRTLSMFVFRDKIGILQRMFDNGPENPVVHLLLGMYLMKEGREDERSRVIYNLCVRMDGIVDKFRWDLILVLSREQPAILRDEKIAGKFQAIPEGVYGREYANFLLSLFILRQDREKVLKAFSDMQKKHVPPDKKTMWHYLSFCHERDIWNPTLAYCCHKLITGGWVDRFVASVAKELKHRGLMENSREVDKALELYGYIN